MLKVFSTERNRNVFANYNFSDFHALMFDTALGRQQVTKEEANSKIREVMFSVLGIDSNSSKKEIRKAIRRNKVEVYEVIEELIPDLLKTGWQENPFFRNFVEFRSMNDGDTNEFYVESDVILTVSKISGGHHDLVRQRLGEGSAFRVQTSWYGVKFSSLVS